jgi:hypothetical protein
MFEDCGGPFEDWAGVGLVADRANGNWMVAFALPNLPPLSGCKDIFSVGIVYVGNLR